MRLTKRQSVTTMAFDPSVPGLGGQSSISHPSCWHDQINPYNPLDLEALGVSLVRELERRPHEPFERIARFMGSGIYALYYVGEQYPYSEMGAFNRMHHCRLPIYIGRAKDPGARQGTSPFDSVADPLLFDRIREHKRSIEAVERTGVAHAPLGVADFEVRALVSMPLWVPLAEAMAIRNDRPPWNEVLPGFGIHAPGSGRSQQRRSQWDQLHAGRGFAMRLPENGQTAEELAALAHAACVRAVRRAGSRLELEMPPLPDFPSQASVE
jgi:hypothetical protein